MRRNSENPLLVGDLVVWNFGREKQIGTVVESWIDDHHQFTRKKEPVIVKIRIYRVLWSHDPSIDASWCPHANQVVDMISSPNPSLSVIKIDAEQERCA